MSEEYFLHHVMLLLSLLFLVVGAATWLKRSKVPYTIGLVLFGMATALALRWVAPEILQEISFSYFSPPVIIYALIPALIFEAAMNIDSRLLIKNLAPVLTLAIPGLALSIGVVGVALHCFCHVDLGAALLFGALISATDPVAVVHLFREIGAPKRLAVLVDGESLFNDATAIVAFNGMIALFLKDASRSGAPTLASGLFEFVYVFLGGLAIGSAIAWIVLWLLRRSQKDPLIQISASVGVAYFSFAFANYYLEVSGVMAALGAGIVVNGYAALHHSQKVREYVGQFWEYVAFIANSVLFLLLGITLLNLWMSRNRLVSLASTVIWGLFFVLLARAVIVYLLMPLVNRAFHVPKVSKNYKHVIFLGGLRGALPLALAFSLDTSYEHRPLVLALTVVVVLFTLLVQGTTLRGVMHWLGLDRKSSLEELDEAEARFVLKEAGYEALKQMEQRHCFPDNLVVPVTSRYEQERTLLRKELTKSHETMEEIRRRLLWHRALSAEVEGAHRLLEAGYLSQGVFHELELNIQGMLDRIVGGDYPSEWILLPPLGTRFKAALGRFLSAIFGRNRLILTILQQSYISTYEMSLSICIVSGNIADVLKEQARTLSIESAALEECERFFSRRQELAQRYLNIVAPEDVPSSFKRHRIEEIAAEAERKELRRLVASHQILEKSLLILEEELPQNPSV